MKLLQFLGYGWTRARGALTWSGALSQSRWSHLLRRTKEEWGRFRSSPSREVPRAGAAPAVGVRYHVEAFAVGSDPFSGDRLLLVGGWFCAPGVADPPVLTVVQDGAVVLEVSCDRPRADVVTALGASAGDYPALPRCGFTDQIRVEGTPGELELLWKDVSLARTFPPGPTEAGRVGPYADVHGYPASRHDAARWNEDGLGEDRRAATPPGASLRTLFFSHTLGLDGMPRLLLHLAAALGERGVIQPTVASPVDGPLRARADRHGLRVDLWRIEGVPDVFRGWTRREEYARSVAAAAAALREEGPEVVVVSTLHSFFMVDAAAEAGIPCVWLVQEHYGASLLRRCIPCCVRDRLEAAFGQAQRIVFASHETMELYRPFQQRDNFRMVHNRVDATAADRVGESLSVAEARRRLDLPPEPLPVLLNVGTVCSRKDQMTFVRACDVLATRRAGFLALIVGSTESDPGYFRMLSRSSTSLQERGLLRIVPGTEEIHPYHRASDVFVLTSLVESFSFAMLEAMSHRLAAVTTPCGGVSEQVRFGTSAVRVPFRDHLALAAAIGGLLDDVPGRKAMGRAARESLDSLGTETAMVADYGAIIAAAAREQAIRRQ